MSEHGGCRWPEQDAVDKWIDDNHIPAGYDQRLALKIAVTKYRVTIQSKLTAVEAQCDALTEELKVNAAMLARQCDLAREAETQVAAYRVTVYVATMEGMKHCDDMETERAKVKALAEALENLYAMVKGEAPGLLEDDHHDEMAQAALRAAGRLP